MIYGSAAFGFSFVTPRMYPALMYDILEAEKDLHPPGTADAYSISLTYFHQARTLHDKIMLVYEGWRRNDEAGRG